MSISLFQIDYLNNSDNSVSCLMQQLIFISDHYNPHCFPFSFFFCNITDFGVLFLSLNPILDILWIQKMNHEFYQIMFLLNSFYFILKQFVLSSCIPCFFIYVCSF